VPGSACKLTHFVLGIRPTTRTGDALVDALGLMRRHPAGARHPGGGGRQRIHPGRL
jgi:hypothetical protein